MRVMCAQDFQVYLHKALESTSLCVCDFHFAGIVFYEEFEELALLNIFMFLLG